MWNKILIALGIKASLAGQKSRDFVCVNGASAIPGVDSHQQCYDRLKELQNIGYSREIITVLDKNGEPVKDAPPFVDKREYLLHYICKDPTGKQILRIGNKGECIAALGEKGGSWEVLFDKETILQEAIAGIPKPTTPSDPAATELSVKINELLAAHLKALNDITSIWIKQITELNNTTSPNDMGKRRDLADNYERHINEFNSEIKRLRDKFKNEATALTASYKKEGFGSIPELSMFWIFLIIIIITLAYIYANLESIPTLNSLLSK